LTNYLSSTSMTALHTNTRGCTCVYVHGAFRINIYWYI
jgi:hypothetical protein